MNEQQELGIKVGWSPREPPPKQSDRMIKTARQALKYDIIIASRREKTGRFKALP